MVFSGSEAMEYDVSVAIEGNFMSRNPKKKSPEQVLSDSKFQISLVFSDPSNVSKLTDLIQNVGINFILFY